MMADEEQESNLTSNNDSEIYSDGEQQSNIESFYNEGVELYTTKVTQLLTDNNYFEQQMREKSSQLRSKQVEMENYAAKLNRFKNQVSERHQNQNRRIVEITEENGLLKVEIALQRIQSFTCSPSDPDSEIEENLSAELNRMNATVTELQNTIRTLSTQRRANENNIRNIENSKLELIRKHKEKTESLTSQHSDELKNEASIRYSEKRELQMQVTRLIHDNEAYSIEMQQHKNKLARLEEGQFKMLQEQQMFQQTIQRLRQESESVKSECNTLLMQKKEKEESFNQLFSVYEVARQRNEVISSEKLIQGEQMNQLAAQVASYQESLEAKEKELRETKGEHGLFHEQMRIYANDYEREHHERKTLDRELQNTRREMERMKTEYSRLQQEQVNGGVLLPNQQPPFPNHQPREHPYQRAQDYPPGGGININ